MRRRPNLEEVGGKDMLTQEPFSATALVEHGQEEERRVLCWVLHLLQQVGPQAGVLLVEAAEDVAACWSGEAEGQRQGQGQEQGQEG